MDLVFIIKRLNQSSWKGQIMILKRLLFIAMIAGLLVGCGDNPQPDETGDAATHSARKVVVQEVVQAPSYSYLQVKEDDQEYWIATSRGEFAKGSVLYFAEAMQMNNFESKELQRTFDNIYFVDRLAESPEMFETGAMQMPPHGQMNKPKAEAVDVDPAQGGVTIGELYSTPQKFAGQNVTVRGKVTKINTMIMGRNWIHLQDGTSSDGKFDLTVTSDELPQVGDIIVAVGTIAVDKDFGSGYFYEIIMEKAEITSETAS
ncbi:hypothetical protein GF406_09550 [candidate division KSB1 bacterium]|nr:hypothetical protein [candidate division KSB1 bacterium]